uniref:CCHC-type domain-containing protein n=1 Tax=Amphimedon queenslandica TaxID=400682 RepID=A0A1X7UUI3_AMPQE
MSDTEETDGTGAGDGTRLRAGTLVSGGTPPGPSGASSTSGSSAVPMELIASMISCAVREGFGGPMTTPGGTLPIPSTTLAPAAGGLHAGLVTVGSGGTLRFQLLRQVSNEGVSRGSTGAGNERMEGSINLSTPLVSTPSVTGGSAVTRTTPTTEGRGIPWSLPDWLKLPEPSVTPPSVKQPLAISSALPPIPARAVEKIEKGVFIDFRELLHDNMALFNTLQELELSANSSVQKMRDISDPLSWAYCFLSFVAVSVKDKHTRDLMAYGQVIIQMARSHGGLGWVNYDKRFCQQMAAGMPLQWAEVNPSLMAATVLRGAASIPAKTCLRCFSWDYQREECALVSLDSSLRALLRTRTYPSRVPDYCCRFNSGTYLYSSERCRYNHSCSSCGKAGHPAVQCPKGKTKPWTTPSPST